MPKKSTNNSKKDRVFDVSKPGSSKPSDNSKNIILKSSALLKDPMVVDDEMDNNEVESVDLEGGKVQGAPPLKTSFSNKINIQPLDKELEKSLKQTENDLSPEPKNELNNDVSSGQEDAPEESKIDSSDDKISQDLDKNESQNIVDSDKSDKDQDSPDIIDPINPSADENISSTKQVSENSASKEEQLQKEAEKKRQQEIDNLVNSRKYALPINRSQKKKNKQAIIIGIIVALVLIVFWINIALDAGIIHIQGVKPFTHFFSNQ